MQIVNIHEAKTNLSKLLDNVSHGDEFIIAKAGKPIARVIPYETRNQVRLGVLKGKIMIHDDDFDKPLPDIVLASFGDED